MPDLLPLNRGSFFAVQETNTEYRTWQKSGNNESTILYDWSSVDFSQDAPLEDLIIDVSRSIPAMSHDSVLAVANGIFQSERLEQSDRFLSVSEQSIEKVGYVEEVSFPEDSKVEVKVKWLPETSLGKVRGRLFEEGAELQALNKKEVKKIERQFREKMPAIYQRLPHRPEEMFYRAEDVRYEAMAPELIDLDFEKIEDHSLTKEDEGGIVRLFYGTNRFALGGKSGYYGIVSGPVQYGFCKVSIPKGHVQGELERPGKFLFIELPENERRHIVLKEVSPLDRPLFTQTFINDLKASQNKHALVFIHGYNNSFEEAARRAAQIAWDLPFNGPAGFFSWPSSGKLPDYLADEAKARSSSPALQEFLRTILQDTGVEKIHLIAHSMGNLILTLSLNAMKNDPQLNTLLPLIHQIVLAAPDIDQEEFRSTLLPVFQTIGARRTIYASDHDGALGVSSFLRRNRKRLGEIGQDIFIDQALDTVEASNIRTEDSHAYMFENQVLLSDIFYLISQNLTPEQRRLRKVARSNLFYWLFPK